MRPVIYWATDRIVAFSLSLSLPLRLSRDLYYGVEKGDEEKRQRERTRGGIPLLRLFDPGRASGVSGIDSPGPSISSPLGLPAVEPFLVRRYLKVRRPVRCAHGGGNRYPFATDRNIRSVKKERALPALSSLFPLPCPSYGGKESEGERWSGWSDVDYQREINRGQIRSRRRTLSLGSLYLRPGDTTPTHPATMYRAAFSPVSQIRRACI